MSEFDNPWGSEYTGSLAGLAAELGMRPGRRSVYSVKTSSPPSAATRADIERLERGVAEHHRKEMESSLASMAAGKPAWPFTPGSKPIETPMLDKLSKAFKAMGIDADAEIYKKEDPEMFKPRSPLSEAKEEARRESVPPITGSSEWRTTSVQWLEENHPVYLSGFSRTAAASARLAFALSSMSYMSAERQVEIDEGTKPEDWKSEAPAEARRKAIASWSPNEHKAMRDFIEDGGYAARLAELRGELTMDGVPGVVEVAENEQPFPVARKSTPPKAKVIAQSLDDVVDLATDPEAGGW